MSDKAVGHVFVGAQPIQGQSTLLALLACQDLQAHLRVSVRWNAELIGIPIRQRDGAPQKPFKVRRVFLLQEQGRRVVKLEELPLCGREPLNGGGNQRSPVGVAQKKRNNPQAQPGLLLIHQAREQHGGLLGEPRPEDWPLRRDKMDIQHSQRRGNSLGRGLPSGMERLAIHGPILSRIQT